MPTVVAASRLEKNVLKSVPMAEHSERPDGGGSSPAGTSGGKPVAGASEEASAAGTGATVWDAAGAASTRKRIVAADRNFMGT